MPDVAAEKVGYDANGSLTTRKNGSGTLLFRQGYDLKNRLVEADADGNGTADLRLAYDHQEGRVARHTLDGSGATVASEHYLLDRMNPPATSRCSSRRRGSPAWRAVPGVTQRGRSAIRQNGGIHPGFRPTRQAAAA